MGNDGAIGNAARCPECQSDLTTVKRRHQNVIDGTCLRCGAKWTRILNDWEWRVLRIKQARTVLPIMPERS
jgi:Zn ribbon nucleic-acid-binding protein